MLELLFYFFIIIALAAFIPFLSRLGAPYVPTHPRTVEAMVLMARLRPGMRVADLGSGDGRLLIAAAHAGAIADGYEINPLLVAYSRRRIRKAGMGDLATVSLGNFWKSSFAGYDVIFVYGVTGIMPRLEEKLRKELPPGARVVSNSFVFPNWPPSDFIEDIHVYTKN